MLAGFQSWIQGVCALLAQGMPLSGPLVEERWFTRLFRETNRLAFIKHAAPLSIAVLSSFDLLMTLLTAIAGISQNEQELANLLPALTIVTDVGKCY